MQGRVDDGDFGDLGFNYILLEIKVGVLVIWVLLDHPPFPGQAL